MIPEIHKESLGTSDYVPEEMDGFYSSYFSYVDDDIKKERKRQYRILQNSV
jgi:hypothetical protein